MNYQNLKIEMLIEQKREEKGMSVEDLAEKVGITSRRLKAIEKRIRENKGRGIGINLALDIAEALECGINDLYKIEDEGEAK